MHSHERDERQAAREMLPWFENGTLDERENETMRALLASDLEANRQRRELRAMHEALAGDATLGAHQALNLRALHARIDAEDARAARRRKAPLWALAASLLLVAGASLFFAGTRVGEYRTLTSNAPLAAVGEDYELVRVDAAAGVDAAALQRLTGDADARVLVGPSAHGVATLAVPRAHAAAVLAHLRAAPELKFVAEVPR